MRKVKLIPEFSFKIRGILTLAVLGTLWSLIEPLGVFDIGTDFFKRLGVVGYIGLLLLSIIVAMLIEYIRIRKQLSNIDIIKIYVTLKTIGEKHEIYVSKHLSINEFFNKYRAHLKKNVKNSRIDGAFEYYDLILKNTSDKRIKFNKKKTFEENGIISGDEFQIKGEVLNTTIWNLFSVTKTRVNVFKRLFSWGKNVVFSIDSYYTYLLYGRFNFSRELISDVDFEEVRS
ncbi:MAG: hypothetical protein AB3N18_07575 [Allomuricauda sp.]